MRVSVRKSRAPGAVVLLILLLVGIGMLIGAYLLSSNTRNFLSRATSTTGEVIRLEKRESSSTKKRGNTYAPVARFITPDGRAIEFQSSSSSNPPAYSVGEKVKILFDPDNPHDARIDSFFNLWGAALIVGGLGIIFTLIGASPLFMAVLALLVVGVASKAKARTNPPSVRPPPPPR